MFKFVFDQIKSGNMSLEGFLKIISIGKCSELRESQIEKAGRVFGAILGNEMGFEEFEEIAKNGLR